MGTLQLTVPVAAPAGRVWQAMTDWERQGDWMLGTTVRTVGPQRQEPGDQLAAFTGVGRLGFWDTMVVTDWRDGVEVTVAHTGRVVRGSGTFRVEPVDDLRSAVIWIENLAIPGGRLGELGWVAIRPVSRLAVRHSLRRFARQVEASGRSPADPAGRQSTR